MYTHNKEIHIAGTPVEKARQAIIMIHGRGATAHSIISLERYLNLSDTAIYAPQATNNSWYPYSFLSPVEDNQPCLDSALEIIGSLVEEIVSKGISHDKVYFLGFSQGACLTLEYAARNGRYYAGIIAFTGGLIGEQLEKDNYKGDFNNTPVLITTGDPDPHVPLKRVEESAGILSRLNAEVNLKVYKGRPHTITDEEIQLAQALLKPE
jgi:phospholipase/carboxylesterase